MPNRVIKESIWTSPNLNQLSTEAERHFYRLMLCPDDFGCCECTPLVIKGRCYPLKPEATPELINQWQLELEKSELIFRWSNGHREYAIFPTLGKHQHLRSFHQRKTPPPPDNINIKCQHLISFASECQQEKANDGICSLHPNPNPNPNPNPIYIVWNGQKIITHEKLTDDIERAIAIALKDNTEEEICQAIKNYAEILKDDKYFFKYSWTLKDFLKRGLIKFLDIGVAKKNYLKDRGDETHKRIPRQLPTHYTDPTEL